MTITTIHQPLPTVPDMRNPVWFDRTIPIGRNLQRIEAWMGHYTERVPEGTVFDEAAVMVPDSYHRSLLALYLRGTGWEKFNEAEDLVFTNPFGTRYFVEYSFYSNPFKPYRLEVMMPGVGAEDGNRGFSPLHAALWVPNGPPSLSHSEVYRYPVPHLSFKPTRRTWAKDDGGTGMQTWGGAYSEAVQHLRDKACIHAMSCQSTYGRFGYYIGNDTMAQVYVKPRINLRDDSDLLDLMAAGAHGSLPGKVTAVCGQPYPCEHAPNGGNHPVVGS